MVADKALSNQFLFSLFSQVAEAQARSGFSSPMKGFGELGIERP